MASLTGHLKNGKQLVQAVEPVTALSPLVTRVMGANPGPYTLAGTNTYLIGNGEKRLLLDTGSGVTEYVDNLKKAMELTGCVGLQGIVVTHWHFDHIGGIPSVQESLEEPVPVYKFMPKEVEAPFAGEGAKDPYSIWPMDKFVPITDGQVLKTQGATLRFHFTPGHANDHTVAVLEEENSMFSGDNVLGLGTGVFVHFGDYVNSLQKMLNLNPKSIYPGHGPVIEDGPAKITEYIQHRLGRVRQIEEFLGIHPVASLESITKGIYPADLAPQLLPPAMKNTLNVLEYLVQEEVVELVGSKEDPRSSSWRLQPRTTGNL